MIITIDLNNPKATYLQIVESVRRAVATGSLKPGDKIPTIREAAVQARVNRNTISRAYLELEHLGIVRARQGAGFFVTLDGPGMEREERLKILQSMADDLMLEAHHYQIETEEIVGMIRASANQWGGNAQSQSSAITAKEGEHE